MEASKAICSYMALGQETFQSAIKIRQPLLYLVKKVKAPEPSWTAAFLFLRVRLNHPKKANHPDL